jgi:hypothetical protein
MIASIWGTWRPQWDQRSKVEFDGANRKIIVHPEVTTLDIRTDVYSAWVLWSASFVDNMSWLPAMKAVGADPIPGGETGSTFFTINGWKLLIDFSKVSVSGVLYSEDYPTAYYTLEDVPLLPTVVSALVNTSVSTQNVVTGSVVTAQESAAAVWAYASVQAQLAQAAEESKKARQLQSNKAVISTDGLSVTIYADDGVTPLQVFSISTDAKTRSPV